MHQDINILIYNAYYCLLQFEGIDDQKGLTRESLFRTKCGGGRQMGRERKKV